MECDVLLKEPPNPSIITSTTNEHLNKSPLAQTTIMDLPPDTNHEEEEDPLALDELTINSTRLLESPPKLVKHTHCLRRQTPRLATKSSSEKSTPSPEKNVKTNKPPSAQASTMLEVLASIPGFSSKPRRRSNKKMSTAAQIEQTKDGKIDLETPDSILVGTNLRALLNTHTFCLLPPLFKQNLVQLLPSVDRPSGVDPIDIRLNPSGLSNEFFARACLEWRERLAEGEFTPENQVRLKTEAEKEKSKLDPWKLKHFEPIWGSKQDKMSLKAIIKLNALEKEAESSTSVASTSCSSATSSPLKQGPSDVVRESHASTSNSPKRIRTVGAMTRAQLSLVSSSEQLESLQASPTKKEILETVNADNNSQNVLVKDDKIGQVTAEDKSDAKSEIKVGKSENENERTVIYEVEVNSLHLDETRSESHEKVSGEKEVPDGEDSSTKTVVTENEAQPNSKDEVDSRDRIEPTDSTPACDSVDTSREASSTNEEVNVKDKFCAALEGTGIVSESSDFTQQHTESHSYNLRTAEEAGGEQLFAEVYKMHNFNGLLQSAFNIQDSTLLRDTPGSNDHMMTSVPASPSHMMPNFIKASAGSAEANANRIHTSSEETTSSTSGLVDCSGDNTAIDEIEPSIQNFPLEDDPIEQKFADAENFLLESEANEDFATLQKRSSKRSSSPEYNERKQLKFNEGLEKQIGQGTDNSTTNSDEYKEDEKLIMDVRYSDTDNADTMDEKTCASDIDVKLDLGGQMLYSHDTDIEKIDAHDLIPSDYSHNSVNDGNEINPATFNQIVPEPSGTESLFADMYKLQNFNGLLQNAFNMQNSFPHSVQRCDPFQTGAGPSHQIPTSSTSENADNFMVSDLTNSSGTGCMGTNMMTCSEETNSSTSGLVDCSGDNSADENAIADIETNLGNVEEEPIDIKFEDAEQYVLESGGEISTDSGEASSLTAQTNTQTVKNAVSVYMDTMTQAKAIPTASSAATLALDGTESLESHINSGYSSLKHVDTSQQRQQQLVTSGTTTSYSSPIVSASSSASCSSVSGVPVPISSQTLSKEDIYHHVAHDWDFGVKMEANEEGELIGELCTSEDQQQEMDDNSESADMVTNMNIKSEMQNSNGPYPNPLYEAMCQKIKNEKETPAGEMEVTSTVTSNSNDSSSDQSVNGEGGHSSKSTVQSMNNSFIQHVNEPATVSYQQIQIKQELKPIMTNSQMNSSGNESYQNLSSHHMPQSFQHSQQLQTQPHFNFQSQQQRLTVSQSYMENQGYQSGQFQHPAQSNVQMSIGSMQRPNQMAQASTSLAKPPFNKVAVNNGVNQQQQQRNPSTYMSLPTSQQMMKVIPNATNNSIIPTSIAQQRPKLQPSGKGRRSSNKLPPGAVNLERSYQICQAVIQNSPNRHQLTAQLRPPPSMLAASSSIASTITTTTSTIASAPKKDITAVVSANRPMYRMVGPRLGYAKRKFVPRRESPNSIIRHVYPSSPAAPGLSVPPGMPNSIQQPHPGSMQAIPGQVQPHQQAYPAQQQQMIQGQYVLIHRANVGAADNQAPRASSAPPAQNQQIHGVNGVPISGRGRPASVDVESNNSIHEVNSVVPGIVRRAVGNQGIPYNENSVIDANNQNYVNSINENSSSNCACSLNPMVICVQCGAFCHDDCISPAKLCISCVIR